MPLRHFNFGTSHGIYFFVFCIPRGIIKLVSVVVLFSKKKKESVCFKTP